MEFCQRSQGVAFTGAVVTGALGALMGPLASVLVIGSATGVVVGTVKGAIERAK